MSLPIALTRIRLIIFTVSYLALKTPERYLSQRMCRAPASSDILRCPCPCPCVRSLSVFLTLPKFNNTNPIKQNGSCVAKFCPGVWRLNEQRVLTSLCLKVGRAIVLTVPGLHETRGKAWGGAGRPTPGYTPGVNRNQQFGPWDPL